MNGTDDVKSYKPIGVLTVAVTIAAVVLYKPVWNFVIAVIADPPKVSDIISTMKCSYVHYTYVYGAIMHGNTICICTYDIASINNYFKY